MTVPHRDAGYSAASRYDSTGGQVHARLRSPYTLSTRLTGGQYLSTRKAPGGKQAARASRAGSFGHEILYRVGRVLERIVFRVHAALFDGARLLADGEHGGAETVDLGLRF